MLPVYLTLRLVSFYQLLYEVFKTFTYCCTLAGFNSTLVLMGLSVSHTGTTLPSTCELMYKVRGFLLQTAKSFEKLTEIYM